MKNKVLFFYGWIKNTCYYFVKNFRNITILHFNYYSLIHVDFFLKKDKILKYYIPKTFFVEKIGENGIDIYTNNQKQIEVTKKERIIML